MEENWKGMKRCTKCKVYYGKSEFSKDKNKSTGLSSRCKYCVKEDQLKRNYKISLEDYNFIYESQKGKCAICGKDRKELKYDLAIDHNHTTGKIRGLLCNSCNSLIGCAEDNKDIIQSAIDYLRGNKNVICRL